MKEIIVKVTNFVNENTMLLIGICAFLILVLIVYLIDNSIKSKKMQKAIKEMDEVEDKVISSSEETNNAPKDAIVEFDIKTDDEINNEPAFDSISLVDEEDEYKEDINEEPVINDVEETKEPEIEINPVNIPSEEPKQNESKFTNKKSLSEILSKKKESINENDIDKTLDETTEFNNTF